MKVEEESAISFLNKHDRKHADTCNVPAFFAKRDGNNLSFKCLCRRVHRHGAGDVKGPLVVHRVAHCTKDDPRTGRGYFLVVRD